MDGAGIGAGWSRDRGPVSPHCRERGSDSALLRIELLRRSEMSFHLWNFIPYATPGALALGCWWITSWLLVDHFLAAGGSLLGCWWITSWLLVDHFLAAGGSLLGCWWISSHLKRQAACQDKQTIATEKQQAEAPEEGLAPKTEPCVPQTLLPLLEEECTENETSTSLLSAGSQLPSLLSQTDERLGLSQDLPCLPVTTQASTLEGNSKKLEWDLKRRAQTHVKVGHVWRAHCRTQGCLLHEASVQSLGISAGPDGCAEQSCVPSETPRALKLPKESKVPFSNGVLKEDGPDLHDEYTKAARDGRRLLTSMKRNLNLVMFPDTGEENTIYFSSLTLTNIYGT
ncbi:uncharacterized protein AAGF69_003137 isoform 2-T2 [Amazona ochrocephala]